MAHSTAFFRLLQADDKAGALAEATAAVRQGRPGNPTAFAVDPASFTQVPGSPFAYWVSESIRSLFNRMSALEGNGREVRYGGINGDDFRFVRLSWEVPVPSVLDWRCWQKGGDFSRYYSDIHLVVDWEANRNTFRGFTGLPRRPTPLPV